MTQPPLFEMETRRLPPNTLRNTLFGSPFSERAGSVDPAALDSLEGLFDEAMALLREQHAAATRALEQAETELAPLRSQDRNCPHVIACKRGLLLYTIWKEPEFASRFLDSDRALVSDLYKRVLPLAGPVFVANLAQRPDAFVQTCAVRNALWQDEPMREDAPPCGERLPTR